MDFTTGQLTFKSNFRGKDCTSGLNATEVISYQYLGMTKIAGKQSCISPRGGRGFSADIKGIFGFKYRKTLSPALILVSSNFIEGILRLKVLASLEEDLPLSLLPTKFIMDFTTGQLTFKSNFRGKDCTSGLNAAVCLSSYSRWPTIRCKTILHISTRWQGFFSRY
jgi:hypothetical protein